MENLVMEIIGRYIVCGCIAYAVLFAVMITRMIWFTVKGTSSRLEVLLRSHYGREWAEDIRNSKRAGRGEMLLRFTVWPYGVIKITNIYLKEEQKLIRKLNGSK